MRDLPEATRRNENARIVCLLKAAFACLRVATAAECLNMLVRSERIYQDMLLAIQVSHRFRENFVIRKFVEIDVDMEFRGFVYNGKLTALAQYNYLIHSERLCSRRGVIARLIKAFYECQVAPKLYAHEKFVKSFVIDFAVFSSKWKQDCSRVFFYIYTQGPKIRGYMLMCNR